ncbi:DUF4236 domain-containing protein [Siminovitchia sediminis]|uniref:DUF4236 domain-containing protein n=1 Tax=Siminovitchia sediminis TaxID=1274353 RepID=A0ABW4KLA2_9BACI
MGLRVRKSFKIAKGVRVNVGKSGASLSFGTKGLRHSIHTSGRRTSTVGLPGTGISYSTSSSGKRKNLRQANNIAQQQKMQQLEDNHAIVHEYEQLIDKLTHIHQDADEKVDWKQLQEAPAPFRPPGPGPNEQRARQELENYSPGFIEKLLPSKGEKRRATLEAAVKEARKRDQEEYDHWKNLHELANLILQGDIDTYFQVIYEMNPLDDLLEFGGEFEFGANDSETLEVEFKVKPDIIPDYSLSLTKTGKVSRKNLTKTAYFALKQDYVCSCVIRIARDMAALLPVERVVVHAVEDVLNTSTGHEEETVILSASIDVKTLHPLNFDRIDPSDALENFPHHMKFLKTQGFKPVEKVDFSTSDSG